MNITTKTAKRLKCFMDNIHNDDLPILPMMEIISFKNELKDIINRNELKDIINSYKNHNPAVKNDLIINSIFILIEEIESVEKMSKTVWINGTERALDNKDRYGMYHAFLDDKDIKWLNSIKNEEVLGK